MGTTERKDENLALNESDTDMLYKPQSALDTNADLYHTTREQLNRLTVIYELTKEILYARDFDELLKKISEETTKLFNATGCMIRLLEEGKLKVRSHYGFPDEIRDAITVCVGEGLAGKVAEEGKTIFAQSPEDLGAIAPNISIQTAICTPLKISDQIIGTFGLYDKKMKTKNGEEKIIPFTQEDMITLEGFASIVAIVIDKSILYEKALRQEKEAIEAKKRVEELRDYLQGFIQNTADAIVTTDLDSIVTSWNIGAEKIYGYSGEEAIGRFLPFVPEFLRETERHYTDRVKRGETIKDI
ncbi:MAG: GAF domain-containing protein, partial [Nitrospirae bacterium]|nr:GAF domain-containing protein [Nitrospirota bacterium]